LSPSQGADLHMRRVLFCLMSVFFVALVATVVAQPAK
jgi:hypothetical protein